MIKGMTLNRQERAVYRQLNSQRNPVREDKRNRFISLRDSTARSFQSEPISPFVPSHFLISDSKYFVESLFYPVSSSDSVGYRLFLSIPQDPKFKS